MPVPVLELRNFNVSYVPKKRPPFHAVKNANLVVHEGEIVGLVGESGSGKSTLGNAAIRLIERPGRITGGQVFFEGKDITNVPEDQLRRVRWVDLSTVFQSSMNSLNPVINIERQFADAIRAHESMSDAAIRQRITQLFEMVRIEPAFMKFFPHELSGGMKQRVALALALVLEPKFVLLDEPTTGLDVVVQRSILENLKAIQKHQGFAVLIISHDLGAIMEVADRVAVMYQGEIVDDQRADLILNAPKHEYSKMLLDAYKRLWIEHDDPAFARRIDDTAKPVLQIRSITKTYTRRRGFTSTNVTAVDNVSFDLVPGKITALVGQSGSGKSTIGRIVTGVEPPDTGTVMFGDIDVSALRGRAIRDYRSHVQLVFQDPYSSLNPAHMIEHALVRPLRNYRKMSSREARQEAANLLEQVGLTPPELFLGKFPHQLSGGQRQRVVVARALAPKPEIIVADEPTSMLDVSIRAEVLEILNRLVIDHDIAMLYITHDLLSARMLADEILVLNHGRVVESGNAAGIIRQPQDEYTRLLLSSIPNPFAPAAAD
jgi:peptide/nickel transport system ATP-binding protein